MKELDRAELEIACQEIAKVTLWPASAASADVIETHTRNLVRACENHIAYIVDMGRDPNIVTRAIRYIEHTHAMPPMRTDVRWFADMLECLIELAVPNSGQTPASSAFLHDVHEGISEWTAANDC